jgi:hypothetical protein
VRPLVVCFHENEVDADDRTAARRDRSNRLRLVSGRLAVDDWTLNQLLTFDEGCGAA